MEKNKFCFKGGIESNDEENMKILYTDRLVSMHFETQNKAKLF